MFRILKELWKFRSLVSALVIRHLRARYRGSVLGFLWSFLNPLCLILVYALVFKYYIRFQEVENYTVFMLSGLLPWIWFSSGILDATSSISSGGSLITKAIFPPHVLPTVAVLTNMANFLLSLPLLVSLMIFYNIHLSIYILYIPVLLLIQIFFMLGLSFIFSSLNVYVRDIQHIMSNIFSLLFFLCPIVYPADKVPAQFSFTLSLNPISRLIINYQKVIINGVSPDFKDLLILASISFVTFGIGCLVFNKFRDQFAESI